MDTDLVLIAIGSVYLIAVGVAILVRVIAKLRPPQPTVFDVEAFAQEDVGPETPFYMAHVQPGKVRFTSEGSFSIEERKNGQAHSDGAG